MQLSVFYRPASPGVRAEQIDKLIRERNTLLAALMRVSEEAGQMDAHAGTHAPISQETILLVREAIASAMI